VYIGGGHPTHRQLGKLRNHANGTLLRRGSCSISLAVEILFQTSIDDFCLAIGLGVKDLGFGFRILCGLSAVRSIFVCILFSIYSGVVFATYAQGSEEKRKCKRGNRWEFTQPNSAAKWKHLSVVIPPLEP
jgi:hypothetical protein